MTAMSLLAETLLVLNGFYAAGFALGWMLWGRGRG
jgi:hypothetical protein